MLGCGVFLFFFFKQKTAYEMRISDWSSDVCSSDLLLDELAQHILVVVHRPPERGQGHVDADQYGGKKGDIARQQPEPAVDVAYEGFEEAVDDVEVGVHGQALCCALSVARVDVGGADEALRPLPRRFHRLLLTGLLDRIGTILRRHHLRSEEHTSELQ